MVTPDIKKRLIKTKGDGKYHVELNLIAWGSNDPKYDIRRWSDEGKYYKGLCMSKEELMEFIEELKGVEIE